VQPFYVLYFARWCCVANTKNLLNAYQYTVCLAMFICFPYSSMRLDPETQNVFYNWVKLPIYPSPKTMVTLTSHLGQKNNTALGKMGGQFPNGKTKISWCITLPKFKKKSLKKSSTTKYLFFYLWGVRVVPSVARRASCSNSLRLSDLLLIKVSLICCEVVIVSTWEDLRCIWPVCWKNKARIKLYQPIK